MNTLSTMKKAIFTFILVCLCTIAYGQIYTTLLNCGSDPLRYIEKNYQDNAAAYIGKTIGFWADQCELQLSGYKYTSIEHSPYVVNKNLLGKIESLCLEVIYKEGVNDYIYYIFIYIDDTTPLSYEEEGKLVGDYNEYWALKFYNFYKNAKIKKIEVYKEINDKFVNNYRRPSTTAIPVGEPE